MKRTAPAFWWWPRRGLAAALLAPVGFVYGRIAGRRMLQAPAGRASVPVVCIGNFVVGGSGKTPFALRLGDRLKAAGRAPVYLLRGYGGRLTGPVVVNPDVHTSEDVGDEAFLLARVAPTVVSADRVAGARLATEIGAGLILMDDGFQNPALHKDLSVALVDAAVGVGNGLCLPAGPLRAPLRTQIVKADVLVVVGEGGRAEPVVHLAARRGLPLFHARLVARDGDRLAGERVFAYAGLGRPEKFFKTLADLGAEVVERRAYPDHHAFTEHEASELITAAEAQGLQLVTTAKDMARLQATAGEYYRWLAARSLVLKVDMAIDGEDRLLDLIAEAARRRLFRASV
ncbi:tetraacyldisaccharide 4'-kinase [Polymorphum gilvum]|uniref:Tetraacyldisaccharide 4'-kinase n=1 Tax=Polymorphum gilvum (strain LMG 25793 / CGMCC 1.9160 / SL003B-26A1) TaxID=991905 RepID=F2IZZ5_POLGS|nr:tetraacyldisaccharide 4'-kinase [Polymorphum gilvum]ADZ71830.1 Tetraacyldisaccharide 4'-kinase [Polymorphum gilvum SL003B-26A1]